MTFSVHTNIHIAKFNCLTNSNAFQNFQNFRTFRILNQTEFQNVKEIIKMVLEES